MSDFDLPVQQAVFARLSAVVTLASVFDDIKNSPEGAPNEDFPYIIIGEDVILPFDTDEVLGALADVNIIVYSRYEGKKQVKEIMQEIYDALHRKAANLTATGYSFRDCLLQYSNVLDMNDGKTRQGICRYRVRIEKE